MFFKRRKKKEFSDERPAMLLVGLGNPGRRYAKNRHNIGFMALDEIARRYGFGPWRKRFQGEIAEGEVGGLRVLALKPMTGMNGSGQSVGEAGRFFKMKAGDVLAVHDELDLKPGKIRVKQGGGAGGHNGLRSLDSHIGPNYRRLRLGVGHPGHKDQVHGFVLRDFPKADLAWLPKLLDSVAEEFPRLVEGDDGGFMSRVSHAMNPPPPKPPAKEGAGNQAAGNQATGNQAEGGAGDGV